MHSTEASSATLNAGDEIPEEGSIFSLFSNNQRRSRPQLACLLRRREYCQGSRRIPSISHAASINLFIFRYIYFNKNYVMPSWIFRFWLNSNLNIREFTFFLSLFRPDNWARMFCPIQQWSISISRMRFRVNLALMVIIWWLFLPHKLLW